MYEPKTYRLRSGSEDLWSFQVTQRETDLFISVGGERLARERVRHLAAVAVRETREEIERHISERDEFLTALEPLVAPEQAPPVLSAMYQAAQPVGVGPMAAVAGAVAERVGRAILEAAEQVIVENGGDIYLATQQDRLVAIHAGQARLSERIGLLIPADKQPLGVCTSSGTVGPSLSFGRADAAVACAADTALADAAATALGNRVQTAEDVKGALQWAQGIAGLRQAVVVIGDTLGAWGEHELRPIRQQTT